MAEGRTVGAESPYHAAELEVQMRAGLSVPARSIGRAISNVIVPAARDFLAARSMVVLGSWDGAGNAWPTLVIGSPGFVGSRDGRQVRFDLQGTMIDRTDPLLENLRRSNFLGVLAIDLASRRRLRVNGCTGEIPIGSMFENPFEMTVVQAYSNCPKYIQRRTLGSTDSSGRVRFLGRRNLLNDDDVRRIAVADTMFVASVCPGSGTDISHRGGRSGFVRVESPILLRIPDYVGNSMFNTLGNIQRSGIAGTLFIDFDGCRMLQIVGDARIDWRAESPEVERSWTMSIREVRESVLPPGLEWRYIDASPFNPRLPT